MNGMSQHLDHAIQYLRDHRQDFFANLKEYVAFPSVSAEPGHYPDVHHAAEWVAGRLLELGMRNVALYSTARHPVVYGEYLEAGKDAPVVLFYGHYDVEPPDPLDQWKSPPFKARVRGEHVYGRGTADMKGQLILCLAALEAITQTGPLPINLKFLIEGEEEIGSPSLSHFVSEHIELLRCDFALNLDGEMVSTELPTIIYGMRGISVCDVTITGPGWDLHSGLFGGAVANPVQVLCKLVAEMQDESGRILLPGFYDRVRALSVEERSELNQTPLDGKYLLEQTGAPRLWGEAGYTPVEHIAARPTLDLNGISGGYSGSGVKTIIPATASAKISLRLVPDQDPSEVYQQLKQFFHEHAPDTVRVDVREVVTAAPVITDRSSTRVQALEDALQTVWGRRPLFIRLGGSVPVVPLFQKYLGVETINTGFAIFSEGRAHSPDENLHLPTWYRGMEALVHYFFNLC
jgi:acetylornithine deacetylase/succinyl-diaminopimelate desuccinylase-like protein